MAFSTSRYRELRNIANRCFLSKEIELCPMLGTFEIVNKDFFQKQHNFTTKQSLTRLWLQNSICMMRAKSFKKSDYDTLSCRSLLLTRYILQCHSFTSFHSIHSAMTFTSFHSRHSALTFTSFHSIHFGMIFTSFHNTIHSLLST